MQGIHAEILALLDTARPKPRSAILASFPARVHPDAVHKAIYELLRSGIVNSTSLGLTIAETPKDDDTQDHHVGKHSGSVGGKRAVVRKKRTVPLYNAVGHRFCNRCEEYLPKREFKFDDTVRDGLYHCCKLCDAAWRREKRATKLTSISPENMLGNGPRSAIARPPRGYPQGSHTSMAGEWSSG